MPTSGDEIRDEVHRRFRVWGWQGAPARRYALLVAGYCRTRGPYHVEGEEKYLSLDRYLLLPDGTGLRLVELVEASADGPFSPTERADAVSVLATIEEGLRRRTGRESICRPYDYLANVNCLRLALDDPQRAAALLILLPEVVPADEPWLLPSPPQYPAVRQVMNCLCPTRWDHTAADWKPPADAVSWARWMYERREFADLPTLADMLEKGGCPDRLLLNHCRSGGDHYRGCAAVDRILGCG